MIRTLSTRTGLAAAIALIWTGSALAQLPASLRSEHPRVLATQADLDRIRQEAAIGPLSLPAKKGKLVFTLTPQPMGSNDVGNADVFGQQGATNDRFYFRYTNATAPAGTIALQIVGVSGGVTAFVTYVYPVLNAQNRIEFEYDTDRRFTSVRLGTAAASQIPWASSVSSWSPSGQQFSFFGNQGDRITDLKLYDSGAEVWSDEEVDIALHRSWRGFLTNAGYTVTGLANCAITVEVGNTGGCDRTADGRATIIESARRLTTAYRMTERDTFLAAARKHIAYLLQVTNGNNKSDINKGGEWDMAARVGALGLYYDWLHAQLGPAERQAIAKAIRDTIAAKDPKGGSNDLVYAVCGYNQTVVTGAGGFDCQYPPTLTVQDGFRRTIADTYVSGHTQSANAGVAMGLLAIGTEADGNADVGAMLNTVYTHFTKGFWAARDFYSVDGGNHALFAYAVSGGNDSAERLVMWKRAMNDISDPQYAPTLKSLPHLIYPYIYALRGNGSYPARGDYFRVEARTPGETAAAAVAAAGDARAAHFYNEYVIPDRNRDDPKGRMNAETFWERLLYPSGAVTPQPLTDLPLSRYFRNAGNVLMRDTWDFGNATLLEFKASSFITVNHHHMDQNSYSLYYKAPLLLDSGQYDAYGSNHWHNYYIRSIAHNTITVFDPTETYSVGTASGLAVDGGQWPGTAREGNPQLHDIQPGGKNVLDGVVAFEHGSDFSYVAGNASKAYTNGKIDSAAGFVRSTVYLQPASTTDKPIVLVFDSVRPLKDQLEITSLLHSVNKPASTIAPTATPDAGRYQFNFLNGVPGPLTIRNNDGMVTVQTLLPAQANVVISGGKNEGATCVQASDVFKGKTRQDPSDCRFLVRKKVGTGFQWQNFAVLEPADNITMEKDSPVTDMGAWRVEISPTSPPPKGTAQYFLNVLHVANSDKRLDGVAAFDAATLLSNESNTVAVATADGPTVVFNGGPAPATSLRWKAIKSTHTLVFGLQKSARYALATVGTPDGARVELKLDQTGTHISSANGTLRLNP